MQYNKIEMLIKLLFQMKKEKVKIYSYEDEFIEFDCQFNQPAKKEDIEAFELSTGCLIPQDYKELLLISNGIHFLVNGELDLFGLEEMKELIRVSYYKKGVYPIGCILGDYIVINSDEINSKKYLYVGDQILADEFQCFGYDFTTFLQNYLMLNFHNYWRLSLDMKFHDFGDC